MSKEKRSFVECLRLNIEDNWNEGGLFESMTKDDCLKACDKIEQLEVKKKRLKERYKDYERLWEIADHDDCDGSCDEFPPHKKCPRCSAGHLINELGEIRSDGLREIEQAIEGEGNE